MRKLWPGRARDEGVVALEFALIAPVFLVLVLGTMVFAIYFATAVAVTHAAGEGARASIAGLDATDRASLAQARVSQVFAAYAPLLDATKATVTPAAGATAGTFQVRVSYPLNDFGFGGFYALLALVTGDASAAPTSISNTVIVANGGY